MTFEQIRENIQYGDFNTLQEVLGTKTVGAARMRFLRRDEEAIKAMQFIHDQRKLLPKKFQTQNS